MNNEHQKAALALMGADPRLAEAGADSMTNLLPQLLTAAAIIAHARRHERIPAPMCVNGDLTEEPAPL